MASAVLEIGSDQADGIAAAVAEAMPAWRCEIIPDLAGLARVARIERDAGERLDASRPA